MRHVGLLLTAIATATASLPAHATIRISGDRGGLIVSYAERFAQARTSGERVVIDGSCLSACTLVIGILPREQVCATSRAVLGFHAAWRPTENGAITASPAATQAMYDIYPTQVRSWLDRRGGLTPHMVYLQGRELNSMVPSCGRGALAGGSVRHGAQFVRHNPGPRVLASQRTR
jgi:hypothetical protein